MPISAPEKVTETSTHSDLPAIKVVRTNLEGVYAVPAFPAGFNFHRATRRQLQEQGIFLTPPTANSDPRHIAAWKSAFDREWRPENRIIPESKPHPGVTHLLRLTQQKAESGNATSYNWSGGVVQDGGGWTSASAEWYVPTVSKGAEAAGTDGGWNSSSWVGLGGWIGSSEILQAGVAQNVDSNGNASYWPWYEWIVPDYQNVAAQFPYVYMTEIPNMTVNAGDQVSVAVSYGTRTVDTGSGTVTQQYGQVTFGNQTNGQNFSIILTPPTGAISDGSSIDWVMERYTLGDNTLASMPDYFVIDFQNCGGCRPNPVTYANPSLGFLVDMLDNSGNVISSIGDSSTDVSISYA